MRHLDYQDRGERLPYYLSDRCNGADERVLVTSEVSRLFQSEQGAVTENSLVENLDLLVSDNEPELSNLMYTHL